MVYKSPEMTGKIQRRSDPDWHALTGNSWVYRSHSSAQRRAAHLCKWERAVQRSTPRFPLAHLPRFSFHTWWIFIPGSGNDLRKVSDEVSGALDFRTVMFHFPYDLPFRDKQTRRQTGGNWHIKNTCSLGGASLLGTGFLSPEWLFKGASQTLCRRFKPYYRVINGGELKVPCS